MTISAETDGRAGGCACGAVRFETRGAPRRGGLCHCLTCRKAHGAANNPFLVFAADNVKLSGETTNWESSPGYRRAFCPACGSRVAAFNGEEVEVSLGSFDEPGAFTPEYELWIVRREPWLAPLEVPQYETNRDPIGAQAPTAAASPSRSESP